MTEPLVLTERREPGIALLTLNRPDQLNAWGSDMAREFFEAFETALDGEDVRLVVVTAAAQGFCAGASMNALNEIRADPSAGAGAATGVRTFTDIALAPKPVVAAINGAVAGVGLV